MDGFCSSRLPTSRKRIAHFRALGYIVDFLLLYF